jgi:metal-sulfur cluster biosynthetic enzyme
MVTEAEVWEALTNCIDPEIPVNLVDLGLIYDVQIEEKKVSIKLTLTTRGCPMHSNISDDVKSKILALPEVENAQVDVVWDPPWNPAMMSESARQKLGYGEQ